eukprot:TRINITY_DN2391_c0_g2_i1.p1 TRINITY_DN2391_c0_g2~~TRINITY_DN2391_c0_g2_i1.p1  ORF type:complete len:139 (+),score=46.85 TRINITY_DN2391_c0_g2_i1:38-418(+)
MSNNLEKSFPKAAIKRIIKRNPEISIVSNSSVVLIEKATRMFIEHLAKESFDECSKSKRKTLDYNHLSKVVHSKEVFDFLKIVIPERERTSSKTPASKKKTVTKKSQPVIEKEPELDEESEEESDE